VTLLSVVTVCKDDFLGLRATRDSFLKQSANYVEHILVVAPSNDGSDDFAMGEAGEGTQAFVIPPNGIYDAMNFGWERAQGDWIMFLNAGDTFTNPTSLQLVLSCIQKDVENEKSLLFAGMVKGEGYEKRIVPRGKLTPWRFAYGRLRVIHSSFVIKRSLIEELGGFSENYDIASDYKLILEALEYPAAKSDVYLGCFHLGGISTKNIRQSLKETHDIRSKGSSLPWTLRMLDWLWYSYLKLRNSVRIKLNYFRP